MLPCFLRLPGKAQLKGAGCAGVRGLGYIPPNRILIIEAPTLTLNSRKLGFSGAADPVQPRSGS